MLLTGTADPSYALSAGAGYVYVVAPDEAIELFLEDLEVDPYIEPSTVRAYRSILGYFEEFCDRRSIDDLADLSARCTSGSGSTGAVTKGTTFRTARACRRRPCTTTST